MDYKRIEELLERYWECNTSLEEEAELKAFFSFGQVPDHLLPDKDLFLFQVVQRQSGVSQDFEERMLKEIASSPVRARRITLWSRLAPLFDSAAIILGILFAGNVIQRSFYADDIPGAAVLVDSCDVFVVAEDASNGAGVTEEVNSGIVLDSLHLSEVDKR